MGSREERERFLTQVRKACRMGQTFRDLGIRSYGVIRIDSATTPEAWAEDPAAESRKLLTHFVRRVTSPRTTGKTRSRGRDLLGGMHGWEHMVTLLETVGRPQTLGFQADMAHTLLYTLGFNAPEIVCYQKILNGLTKLADGSTSGRH